MSWLTVMPLNQLAAAWRDVQLGTCVNATIGTDGCLVTDLAFLAGVTPVTMNDAMKAGGGFYRGCLATTFDLRRIGFPAAPALLGVTKVYKTVPFPELEISRVWNHVSAGGVGIACIDFDPETPKYNEHWLLLVAAFGSPGVYRDFVVTDPYGGIQTTFSQRYGALPRALVRVALYGGGALSRHIGEVDARQASRASIPKEAIRDK